MPTEIYRSPWFNLEGYLACTVKYSDGSKKTVLQHRELMEKHLGKVLSRKEHVHHKNEDKRDNRIENLEVKNAPDHARDHQKPAEVVSIRCMECGEVCTKLARNVRHSRNQGKVGPFCGKRCVGRWSRRKQLESGQVNLR